MGLSTCYASPWIYYSLACFSYLLVGVFGAVVRWCHMCRPYASHGDFFYPARRHVAFFYFFTALQLPYVLCPSDPAVWLYVRIFCIVYYPICFAVLFFRYFRMLKVIPGGKSAYFIDLRDPYAAFFLPFLLLVAMFVIVMSGHGSLLSDHRKELEYVMGALSLMLSFGFMRECWLLSQRLNWYNEQNYSNDEDFSYGFAKRVLWIPSIATVVMWAIFLSDSREVYMAMNIVMMLFMLAFLCQILSPNKSLSLPKVANELEHLEKACFESVTTRMDVATETGSGIDETETVELCAEGGVAERPDNVDDKEWETVKAEVLSIVARRYLEPNLKRVDVIHDVVKSKHTLAGTFITQVGFYRLVNAFRVRHYEMLTVSPPANMSQEMAAEICGFKNRWALSNARKRLTDFDYTIIDDYLKKKNINI